MRLRTKYALVLVGIMLLVGSIVLGGTEFAKQQAITQANENLENTANASAQQIREALGRQWDELGLFGARPEIKNFSRSGEYLPDFINRSDFFAVQLVDANGTILDFQGDLNEQARREAIGTDISNRTYFRQAIRGATHVAPPERFGNTGNFILRIGVPVGTVRNSNYTERTDGILVGALQVGKTGSAGQILDATDLVESSRRAVTVTARTAEGNLSVIKTSGFDFQTAIRQNATVRDVGWIVSVSRDRASLTQRLRTLQYVQAGGLILIVAAFVGLGVWQYRTNLSQTERLLIGFSALERGEFDYSLSMGSAREWQEIGDGFNELAQGLREREQAIREREQRLSVLNRVLRHNLQNDLTVVQGYAEMMHTLEDDEIEDAQEEIMTKVEGLIEHGQKARRIEEALESAEEGRKDIDVVSVIEKSLREYSSKYPDVEVETHLPEAAWVRAITSLQYGIESIVENAFEHNTSEEPHVEVTVQQENDNVEVAVIDNGPGIPEHEYQVLEQEEETALEHGSGIGLWLSYWVVEKSDGDLEFETDERSRTAVRMFFDVGTEPEDAGGDDLLDF